MSGYSTYGSPVSALSYLCSPGLETIFLPFHNFSLPSFVSAPGVPTRQTRIRRLSPLIQSCFGFNPSLCACSSRDFSVGPWLFLWSGRVGRHRGSSFYFPMSTMPSILMLRPTVRPIAPFPGSLKSSFFPASVMAFVDSVLAFFASHLCRIEVLFVGSSLVVNLGSSARGYFFLYLPSG